MFNTSDRIKLNEEIFPEDKRTGNPHFQTGQLNYPALILDWEMEVLDSFTDSYHGNMVKVKVLNDDRLEPDAVVYMRVDDCVIAKATKLKIEYTILGKMVKNQPFIDANRAARAALMKERDKMRKKYQVTDVPMKKNWKEVQVLDNDLKTLQADKTEVLVVRTPALGEISLECNEDQIPNKIRSLIRSKRKESRTIKSEEKIIAGDIKYTKVGGVLEKKGQIAEISKGFAMKVINEPKKPTTTTDNYVGIELECYAKIDRPQMKEAFIKAGLKRFVNVGEDGSIRPTSGHYAMEVRVCVSEKELETILPRIFKVLDDNGAKVNDSCGTHVHLDMRNRDVELAYKNLFQVQNLMFATQPTSRRSNSYCRPSQKSELTIAQFGQTERYSAINVQSYSKHKTIEIRLHQGTVTYEDMKNWINFLIPVVSTKKTLKKIDTIKELVDTDLVSSETVKHLDKRIKKYA